MPSLNMDPTNLDPFFRSNQENMFKVSNSLRKGDVDGAKQHFKDNMDSIQKYLGNPERRKMALITLKVKSPEIYEAMVKAGKEIEKQKRMSGEQKDINLKKMLLGDFYYADFAYGEALKGLDKYYGTIQKELGLEEKSEDRGFDRNN